MNSEYNKSLSNTAISGMKWTTISQAGREGIRLITLIILTKLLQPADFGLVSMSMIVIGFSTIFKDLGTSKALIQKQSVSLSLINSIFTANILFGTLITLILILTAPFIANFFEETKVTPILRLLSLTFFISSFSVVHQALLEKEVKFQSLAKVELTAIGIGAILGVGAALMGYGVYSLVVQSIANVSTTSILLWLFNKAWTPKIELSISELKNITNFSLNIMGFNILNYFSRNADYLIIGKWLGAEALGFYTLAYRIMIYPLQYISNIISRVMYPIFSNIQSDLERFRNIYIYLNQSIAIITFPLMLGLVSVADLLVNGVLDSEWVPAIPLIMILAPVGLLQSITTNVGLIYQAKNRTDWLLNWGIVSSVIIVLAFLVGVNWGGIGVAVAYSIVMMIITPLAWHFSFKLINLRIRKFTQALFVPTVSSISMFVVVISIKNKFLPTTHPISLLVCLSILGAIIYFIMIWFIDNTLLKNLLKVIIPSAASK